MTFADELRRVRTARRLTQGMLARQCRIERSYITRLEGGSRTTPSREVVNEIIAALDATPNEANRLLVSAGYIPPSIAHLIAAIIHEGERHGR